MPAALEMIRTNLPISATRFVARAGEIERVKERLRDVRLPTLSRSGGCGKRRLALEVARQFEGECVDGISLIDLARLANSALVPEA